MEITKNSCQNPFFSIIIPTYNMSKWLPYAIESVINQTFHDFELLIQDNASTDKTKELIDAYQDPRLSYQSNATNLGMFANINIACSRAKGKYIKILCADDKLSPVCLEVIYSNKNCNQGENYKIISVNSVDRESLLEIDPNVDESKKRIIDKNNIFMFLSEPDNWGAGLSSVCFENSFFKDQGLYGKTNVDKDFSKDIVTFFLLVLKSPALLINKKLVYLRSHEQQNRYILKFINQLEEIFDFFEQCVSLGYNSLPCFTEGRRLYLNDYILRHYWYGIKSFLKTGNFLYIRKVISLQKRYNYFSVPLYSLFLKLKSKFNSQI